MQRNQIQKNQKIELLRIDDWAGYKGDKENGSTELITWTSNISYSRVLPSHSNLHTIHFTTQIFPKHFFYHTKSSTPQVLQQLLNSYFSQMSLASYFPLSPNLTSIPWLFKSDYPVSPVIFWDHLLYVLGSSAKVRHLTCIVSLAFRSTLETTLMNYSLSPEFCLTF